MKEMAVWLFRGGFDRSISSLLACVRGLNAQCPPKRPLKYVNIMNRIECMFLSWNGW